MDKILEEEWGKFTKNLSWWVYVDKMEHPAIATDDMRDFFLASNKRVLEAVGEKIKERIEEREAVIGTKDLLQYTDYERGWFGALNGVLKLLNIDVKE